MSDRTFTKGDCIDWLDSLADESVDLWVLDPPYNVLTGNMKNKNGAAVFHSRYTAKVSPSESDLEKGIVTPRFEVAIPWEEKHKLDDYKEYCYKWYCKAHQKLCDDSFMFIFWSMRYLYLAYQIFDVNRVVFWQQPNMVSSISGDFCYDITPIIVVRKGNPRLNKEAGLWDKSSILKFTKPQGNYVKDKLCHPCFAAGTKVYVNNEWKNIEQIKVGDMTSYGKVQEVMINKSNDIYELETELGKTTVTGNHPILVIDEKGTIQWKQVSNMTDTDLVLQKQDITEKQQNQEHFYISISGKNLMVLSQKDMIYTILTEERPIIELKTSNLSNMDYTANIITKKLEVAHQDTKFVIDVVENYNLQMNTGIRGEDTTKDRVKSVYCRPVKIKNIKKKEMQEDENLDVYNLAVQNNNFYDVENIGIVHNCQKPQGLLEHLVWLSGADKEGNTIGDFFAGSGSLLRAVNKADVILCDQNDEYYDKFFDVYVKDERVYKCKKEKLVGDKNESV